MSVTERGIFRELLDECWAVGSVPSDFPSLAEIAVCTASEIEAAWPNLAPCFVVLPNGDLRNEKIEKIRAEQVALSEKKRHAGQKGGTTRWKNGSTAIADDSSAIAVLGSAQAVPSHQSKAKQSTAIALSAAGPMGPPPHTEANGAVSQNEDPF